MIVSSAEFSTCSGFGAGATSVESILVSKKRDKTLVSISSAFTDNANAQIRSLQDLERTLSPLALTLYSGRNLTEKTKIGWGATYDVWRCADTKLKQVVAVKQVKLPSPEAGFEVFQGQVACVLKDIEIMSHPPIAEHRNITNVFGYGWKFEQNPVPFIVTEYAAHRTLRRYLKDNQVRGRAKLEFCRDVASGLKELHLCGICHGDMKLDNVLVAAESKIRLENGTSKTRLIAKITDFGHSLLLSPEQVTGGHQKYHGTRIYNAPEVSGNAPQVWSKSAFIKCDIWATGLLFFEVLLNGARYHKHDTVFESLVSSAEPSLAIGSSSVNKSSVGPNDDEYEEVHLEEIKEKIAIWAQKYAATRLRKDLPLFSALMFENTFRVTLDNDPKSRLGDVADLPIFFGVSDRIEEPRVQLDIPVNDPGWSFENFRPQNMSRIQTVARTQMFAEFKRIASSTSTSQYPSIAAFQAGFASAIGFGTVQNQAAFMEWIKESAHKGSRIATLLIELLNSPTHLGPSQSDPSESSRAVFNAFVRNAIKDRIRNSKLYETRHGPASNMNLTYAQVYKLLQDKDWKSLKAFTCPETKQSGLLFACQMGDAEAVSALISAGADATACSSDGCSPLHYLFMFEPQWMRHIVKLLLPKGDKSQQPEPNLTPKSSDQNLSSEREPISTQSPTQLPENGRTSPFENHGLTAISSILKQRSDRRSQQLEKANMPLSPVEQTVLPLLNKSTTRIRRIHQQLPVEFFGTPLCFAIAAASSEAVTILLELGAEPLIDLRQMAQATKDSVLGRYSGSFAATRSIQKSENILSGSDINIDSYSSGSGAFKKSDKDADTEFRHRTALHLAASLHDFESFQKIIAHQAFLELKREYEVKSGYKLGWKRIISRYVAQNVHRHKNGSSCAFHDYLCPKTEQALVLSFVGSSPVELFLYHGKLASSAISEILQSYAECRALCTSLPNLLEYQIGNMLNKAVQDSDVEFVAAYFDYLSNFTTENANESSGKVYHLVQEVFQGAVDGAASDNLTPSTFIALLNAACFATNFSVDNVFLGPMKMTVAHHLIKLGLEEFFLKFPPSNRPSLLVPNSLGDTGLHYMARFGFFLGLPFNKLGLNDNWNRVTNIQGQTALAVAIESKKPREIRILLENNAGLLTDRNSGIYGLCAAIRDRNDLLAYSLIYSRIDLNAGVELGNTALMTAASYGLVNLVDVMIAKGADPMITNELGQSCLHHAVLFKQYPACKQLISHGGKQLLGVLDKKNRSSLKCAIEMSLAENDAGHLMAVAHLDQGYFDEAAWTLAVGQGRSWLIEAFLQRGTDPRNPKISKILSEGLIQAVQSGSVSTIHNLIRFGARLEFADSQDMTCVHHAVLSDRENVLAALLSYKPATDLRSSGKYTALEMAFSARKYNACFLLIEAGASYSPHLLQPQGIDFGSEHSRYILEAYYILHHSHLPKSREDLTISCQKIVAELKRWCSLEGGLDWDVYGMIFAKGNLNQELNEKEIATVLSLLQRTGAKLNIFSVQQLLGTRAIEALTPFFARYERVFFKKFSTILLERDTMQQELRDLLGCLSAAGSRAIAQLIISSISELHNPLIDFFITAEPQSGFTSIWKAWDERVNFDTLPIEQLSSEELTSELLEHLWLTSPLEPLEPFELGWNPLGERRQTLLKTSKSPIHVTPIQRTIKESSRFVDAVFWQMKIETVGTSRASQFHPTQSYATAKFSIELSEILTKYRDIFQYLENALMVTTYLRYEPLQTWIAILAHARRLELANLAEKHTGSVWREAVPEQVSQGNYGVKDWSAYPNQASIDRLNRRFSLFNMPKLANRLSLRPKAEGS